MNIEEAIAKKEDIEHAIAQRLNAFTKETGLTIEQITINESPRIHGFKPEIGITLDVRL